MKGKLHKENDGYSLSVDGKIFGDTDGHPLKAITNKLSNKNCQVIERGYDLDELATQHLVSINDSTINTSWQGYTEDIFKAGFQKALELKNDKLFTLDDIYTVFIMGREGMEDKMNRYVTRIHEPTEWDVEIEMEPYHDGDFVDDGNTHVFEPKFRPALDSNGCLILKGI